MHDRTARTRLLLGSLADAEPTSHTSTGRLVAHSALPGPGEGRKGACRTCRGGGRLIGPTSSRQACHRCTNGEPRPHGCRACAGCGGSGRVWYDSVLGKPTSEAVAEVEKERRHALERQAKHLASVGEPERREEDAAIMALQVAAGACGASLTLELWRAGSYTELVRALEAVHLGFPRLHAAVWNAWVRETYTSMSDAGKSSADRGLVLVVRRMPTEIRVPSMLMERLQAERRASVRTLLLRGKTTQEIAHALGVSYGVVQHIRRTSLAPAA